MAIHRSARPRRSPSTPTRHTRQSPPADRPRTVVIGFGRMGGALALGLARAGWPLSVFPRSGESLRRAAGFDLRIADQDDLGNAELCVFAVPEAAVHDVAQSMLLDLGLSTALVHCAGALDTSAFGSSPMVARRMRGSFHPLVAVSDPEDALEGHAVAVSATGRPLLQTLRRMAEDLRLFPIEISETRRSAYHAGAVLAAGGVVSLLSAAVASFGEAGVEPETALRALLPLARSALRGVEERGLTSALTGPVKRGEIAVIEAHLAALPGDLQLLYRVLSLRALELCGAQLPLETRHALNRLLR
jgi:predicted short-subunit dehydrogenase-like oxidoreductase (DUF2520 family)